jgi:putative salt-induced outer membrane protein YdiY
MLRPKPTPLFLRRITLFACLLAPLTWTAANAQDASPPDPSTEISQEKEPTATGPQAEEEVLPPSDVMAPPMMSPSRSAPAYDRKKYDWIRLTSGEWLKGDIISMRNENLEFDSDEMDEQDFDWEDIAELRSSRKYTYVFTDRTALIGTALVTDKEVVISVNGEDRVFKRARLMSIIPAGESERDRWDGKMSLGVAFRRGNTNQTDLTYQAFVRRRDALTRVRLDLNGALGEVEGEQNVNNHRSTLKLDLFTSPRFYITPFAFILYHDTFQNIDIQVTPYAGFGYHALKKKKATCDLELAGGYQYTRYSSVEEGADQDKRNGAILPTIRIETDPLKAVDFDVLYQAGITVPDPGDTTMHGEVILSIEITKIFDLDVSWFWDRVQSPQPNEDGTVPKQDDVKLTVGIGIDF